jgi:predicted small secreted protein
MRCRPLLAVLTLASALVAGCGTTESADRQAGAVEAAAPTAPLDYGHVQGLSGVGGDLITNRCAIACVAG